MRRNGAASLTVFSALAFLLVTQLFFALLASARQIELGRVLQMNTESVLESAFAQYCRPLWEEYRLLGCTAKDENGEFSLVSRENMLRSLSEENVSTGSHLLCASVIDLEFTKTLLMTDHGGKVFCQAVTSYMKRNLGVEAAKTLYNEFESIRSLKNGYGDSDTSIGEALDALKSLSEGATEEDASQSAIPATQMLSQKGRDSSEVSILPTAIPTVLANETGAIAQDSATSGESAENLLTTITEIKKKGILSLVLPKDTKVSERELDLSKTVSHRNLFVGNADLSAESSWYDQILMYQYLLNHLDGYTDMSNRPGLCYELEYVLGGKAEDRENLKLIVHEILALREAMNLASLVANPTKQAEALAMATLLAGITVNPLIITAVKYGILAAWAYAESILDLRALLQGERVAVLKSEIDWTTDLSAIPELLSGYAKAKSNPMGMRYKDYLGILLLFHKSETIAMRTMDIEEYAIRQVEGYEMFRMDSVVCEADVRIYYEYPTVFLELVWLKGENGVGNRIVREAEYSYFHEPKVT